MGVQRNLKGVTPKTDSGLKNSSCIFSLSLSIHSTQVQLNTSGNKHCRIKIKRGISTSDGFRPKACWFIQIAEFYCLREMVAIYENTWMFWCSEYIFLVNISQKTVLRGLWRCKSRSDVMYIHWLYFPFCFLLIYLYPQARFSIMCQLFEPHPQPCPSHKTMMSWYSRDKHCQLQWALPLSVCTQPHKGFHTKT